MGRWAQRRRGGGGTPAATELVSITQAQITASQEIEVTYSQDVSDADYNAGDYQSNTSGEIGSSLMNSASNRLTIFFASSVVGDTDVAYTGAATNTLTPQTVNYT